ncbi:hypothetical protein E9232_006363 [Inquilinus ginsengisoli]|uniref:Bacterial virulence protein VirB8 domain-containing protein n=1 Tax=Inquilinus ginsengisoli TaxID=363840 RepID=A0ABU1JYV5_9PROT|nr:hypothetical protein [Inquilinus ginsengisoli]MDR6293810.1 hypothetical protein [Inquilinus ginsengisoli]
MLDSTYQDKLAKTRTATQLARYLRSNLALLVLSIILGATLFVVVNAYTRVVDTYANNVRTAWVKLSPNGDSKVEYIDDGGNADRYFDRAVLSSLTNYLTWRFRVQPQTIKIDYGNASTYLGPAEADKFLNDFKAAQQASEKEACVSCPQSQVVVRAIDNTLLTPAERNKAAVYKTAAFITVTQRDSGGGVISRDNKIVNLDWTFRPASEASQGLTLEYLAVNPLAIQILSQDVREDKS